MELANRFPDFRQNKIKLKLFAQPFELAVEDSPEDCQMELIERQADMDTKSQECNIIAEGFRFMPLGLVRLRTFRRSTWVS